LTPRSLLRRESDWIIRANGVESSRIDKQTSVAIEVDLTF
jgi:hypothetical protein